MVVDVLTQIKSQKIDQTFSYHVPENLKNNVKIGSRVKIPFGSQVLEGFIVCFNTSTNFDYKIKDIIDIIDLEPVLNKELIEIGNYISKKEICTRTSAYQTMLPVALKAKAGTKINEKYETYLVKLNDLDTTSKKQIEVLELFKDNIEVKKSIANEISVSAVKTLINKGILKEEKREVYRINEEKSMLVNDITLTKEQENVINDISKNFNTFYPCLIHGVTGSGKTEVYIRLVRKALEEEKEAILLVPEISLTPQVVEKFRSHFGSTIAILHSGLSNGEKYDEWRKIVRKEVSIVIGARSAIFAPFDNLGIIIIDEEHSETYKQENIPHYHANDIALRRGKIHNCPVVLGSATPSLESYTRTKLGVYKLYEMNNRVNNNMPKVHLVDMKDELKNNKSIFSNKLKEAIKERLEKNEQTIILLNRRGYTTIYTCHNCGYKDLCPNCDIPLTYHKSRNIQVCHYCNYQKQKAKNCPNCNSSDMSTFGLGTQKLEEEIKKEFGCKVLRMDVDTTKNKGSHSKMIKDFENGKYDILVGTQMIAKGLDFPNVTLVGVIKADSSLNIPDFRSAERTFQLLSQVAGRSGRSKKEGIVILQGFNMDHYSILSAGNHDYKGYYDKEIKIRKQLHYPPFYNLCLIKLSGKNLKWLYEEGEKIKNYLNSEFPNNILLGPNSGSMPKVNGIYTVQLILKYKSLKDIYSSLEFLYNQYKKKNGLTIDIDTNPYRL